MLLRSKHATTCPDSVSLLDLRLSSGPPAFPLRHVLRKQKGQCPSGAESQERRWLPMGPGCEARWLRFCGLGGGEGPTFPILYFSSEASLVTLLSLLYCLLNTLPSPPFLVASQPCWLLLASHLLSWAPIQSLVTRAA